MISKIFNIHIISLGIISAVLLYLTVSYNLESIFALTVSLLLGYVFSLLENKPAIKTYTSIILAGVLGLYLHNNLYLTTVFLLGINFSNLYFQLLNKKDKFFSLQEINVAILANLVFISGISKFRGFNRLDPFEVQITIPLLLLSAITISIVLIAVNAIVKKYLQKYEHKKPVIRIFSSFLVLNAIYFAIAYYFYTEIGIDVIFLPLIAGSIAGLSSQILKTNSLTTNILETVLLIITPYQIAGFVGIGLALLSAILFTELIGNLLLHKKPSASETIYKLSPLIFLFSTTEIRENEGLITRFNLSSGYQVGWILIGVMAIEYMKNYIDTIGKFIEENNLDRMAGLIGSLFTLAIFTIIIKFGSAEALVAFIIGAVIYLVLLSILDYKRYIEKVHFAFTIANCIGILAFLILTKI